MIESIWEMTKILFYTIVISIPIVAVAIYVKNNVKHETLEIIKIFIGIVAMILLIYLSIKG